MIPSPPLGTDTSASPSGSGAPTGACLGEAAGPRRFRFELAAHPGSPAQARRLVRARLTGWSVCEDTCDSAALVVSELVTNAIVHTASSQIMCELQDGDDLVRIAVHDEGCAPGEPHPSLRLPEEEHGRGLLLVGAVCRAWGVQEYGPGLMVWAELPRGSASAPRGSTPAPRGSVPAPRGPVHASRGSVPAPRGPAPAREAREAREARNDLGWGARSKPGPPRDTGDGKDSSRTHRGTGAVWQ